MTTVEILEKLSTMEKLLERLVLALEPSKEEASMIGENETPDNTGEEQEVDQSNPDDSFQEYFQEYGTHDDSISLRTYGYTLSASDTKRQDAILLATKYKSPSRVYYHLMALHKVWKERKNGRNDIFVENLATDIQFVKTKYMS